MQTRYQQKDEKYSHTHLNKHREAGVTDMKF